MAMARAAASTAAGGYIVGPVTDWICFIGSPLLAIGVVLVAKHFAWAMGVTNAGGQPRTRLELFAAVWTYGHLFAVVFRSHFNRTVFARFPLRFTVVPLALYVAFALSNLALVTGFLLIAVWDVYHSSMQNFGLARIYDAKAGNDPAAHRQLDVWISHVAYVGPILVGASLLPTIDGLRAFQALGFDGPPRLYRWIGEHLAAIRACVYTLSAAYVVVYVDALLRRAKAGHPPPLQKLALLASVAVGSFVTWTMLPPLEAFVVSNLFHALQYFAIVWWTERTNLARVLRLPASGAGLAATFACFAATIVAAGSFHEHVGPGSWHWLVPIPMVISLMHFWWDGFVWSVRRGEV